MTYSRRLLGVIALCLVAVAAHAPRVALGQSDDKISASLTRAREAYETNIQTIRVDVVKAIDAKIDAASKPDKVDKDKQKEAGDEKDAFIAKGELPNIPNAAALRNRYAKAAKTMTDAYGVAIGAYTKATNNALRDAIRVESEEFVHWDLVPWQDKITKDSKSEAERTLSPDGTPLAVETGLKGEYRLEIKAKRSGDSGTLSVEFLLADGKRLKLPAVAGDKGDIRMLLTIREGHASADLGVARPIDFSNSVSGDANGIVLSASAGTIMVESVRVKPVVKGTQPEIQELVRKTKRDDKTAQPSNEPAQIVPQGSKWTGTFHNSAGGHNADAVVLSQSGSNVVFRVSVGDYGTRDWDFAINGHALVLNECRIVKTKFNNTIKNINVRGAVNDGRLGVAGTWIYQGGGGGGGETIRLDLSKK